MAKKQDRHGAKPGATPKRVSVRGARVRGPVARGDADDLAPLEADFSGTCSLEIYDSPSPPPTGDYPLHCRITFSPDRQSVSLSEFEPIRTGDYAAKLGPLTVTNSTAVHLKSSARGTLTDDGHFAIEVVLHFDHSFDAPFVEEDSDLPITLSTHHGGKPLDSQGGVMLIGSGRFVGGALDGCRCHLTYRGRVAPMPW